ncbi:membrane protein [Actinokineospora iranica]|uniref:Membrane protein n=1 Tax=Actinokineospora iranica TaxID=1271860 RepID=A0A1G6S7I5_9PSEU|nr:YhjD/YihY/BrkB family envelope integrity protein [Actinokineospora iranica]SDD12789.1 membrane protein [Actinokineospora iranica]
MRTQGSAPDISRWRRYRDRYRWFDHLARAVDRYIEHSGYQYVASITYFSLLSVVPMLMVGFSTAGFVLAGQPGLLAELRSGVTGAVPGPLGAQVGELLDNLIGQRAHVGVLGLLIGLYSGWNWMNALRDALTAMWDQHRGDQPLLRTVVKDLVALVSLVLALLVSFLLTVAGGAVGDDVLRLAHLDGTGWASPVLVIASSALALVADWLVFLWVLARLPREPVSTRSAMRGAVAAALGFELLKLAGNVYVRIISDSPTGVAFGSVIGLLVFISLVSRLLVFITAWTATARPTRRTPPPPPGPVVIQVSARARPPAIVLTGLGAAAGALAAVVLGRLRGKAGKQR